MHRAIDKILNPVPLVHRLAFYSYLFIDQSFASDGFSLLLLGIVPRKDRKS